MALTMCHLGLILMCDLKRRKWRRERREGFGFGRWGKIEIKIGIEQRALVGPRAERGRVGGAREIFGRIL